MKSSLHLEIAFDDAEGRWSVGALSEWNGRIELARSSECAPFTNIADIRKFVAEMVDAWAAPPLGIEMSESLHDTYSKYCG